MKCKNCGAGLSLEDMTRPNCPFCKSVLEHHARAEQHAELVNKILERQMGALMPGQRIDVSVARSVEAGSLGAQAPVPPQIGYQFGAGLTPQFQQAQQQLIASHLQTATRRSARMLIGAVLVSVATMMLVGGGVVLWLFW
ncbi:MAG: hypothetical protein OZ921_04485 [Sorangiineae bacterium]|nr:hypothetical protein [Polyangiaceae bacterium]MEB2321748.1 hypothetical protein [Sorangiineae bacterium]